MLDANCERRLVSSLVASPLNVLFITADQWRGDCLSALGHPWCARRISTRWRPTACCSRRHYANAAPCGPSRASLHTGMYLQNHRSGTNGTPLDARHTNWAQGGRGARLRSGAVRLHRHQPRSARLTPDDPWLKTYEGPLPGIRPVVPDDRRADAVDRLAARPRASRRRRTSASPTAIARDGPDYEDGAAHPRPLGIPAEVDDTAFLAGKLIDYIKGASGPFIAHLSLLRPHPPFVAPEPYNAMYDPARGAAASRAWPAPKRKAGSIRGSRISWRRRVHRATDNEKRLRRLKAVYYGLMSRVDAEIGRLIGVPRRKRALGSTLIIFTSDHGEEIGDHWLIGKGGYFDGSYHIPLIVRDPRAQADAERGAVVSSLHRERRYHADDARGDRRRRFRCNATARQLAPFLEGAGRPGKWRERSALGVRLPRSAATTRRARARTHDASVHA